jgi:hypothetical protein
MAGCRQRVASLEQILHIDITQEAYNKANVGKKKDVQPR